MKEISVFDPAFYPVIPSILSSVWLRAKQTADVLEKPDPAE